MLRKKLGAFYLIELLGTGGRSQVYLALNPGTRQKRAIKLLTGRAIEAPMVYARFLREVDNFRCLRHENIVKVFESGSTEDSYYYGMEYMPGGSLSRKMRNRPIPLQEVVHLFAPICDAMTYAHNKGVIHRNLKPANILFDAAGTPKISDFGIALVRDGGENTSTHSCPSMGSVAYLAPEQRFNGQKVDRRVDVYALGAILYEMIMGFPPLGKFPWPKEIQDDFPELVQLILEKCLAIEPKDRYLHAGFLMSDISRFRLNPGQANISIHIGSSYQVPRDNEKVGQVMNNDRIERWFDILRSGTTRERLAIVREMVERMDDCEANAILKLYFGEEDRVRWGLIRSFGELRITAATPMIIAELKNSFHRECAIAALGKIGASEAFAAICDFVVESPESALIGLLPLARTGREKAIPHIRPYLVHEMAGLRQAAVKALAAIATQESLKILKHHLAVENNEKVRATIVASVHYLEELLFPHMVRRLKEAVAV